MIIANDRKSGGGVAFDRSATVSAWEAALLLPDDLAAKLFLTDGCPLPKATHVHDHYEAITGADTLMMSMLQLGAARQTPPKKLALLVTDR
jgi:hypothetical protein